MNYVGLFVPVRQPPWARREDLPGDDEGKSLEAPIDAGHGKGLPVAGGAYQGLLEQRLAGSVYEAVEGLGMDVLRQ